MLFGEADSNDIFNRPGYGISVGAGLRLNLPAVGPLRIDYAIPIGGNTGDHVRNFNFGAGQKF
jgi:outer membrane protein assembly factor BamA